MTQVVLITAQPRVVATGATTTVRLAGGGDRKGYHYLGEHWQAGVARLPKFSAALGFDQNGWTGGSVPVATAITFMPARHDILATLAAYYWREAAITVQVGDEETETFETVLTGTVENIAIAEGAMTLNIADLAQALNKPILTDRFEGTGGIEGGEEAKGRLKRRNYGRVFNVEGRVLDKANNIYEFGDPDQRGFEFVAIRDKGREGSFTSIVEWQGSVAATLTALEAATPTDGEGVAAPSIQCVKWWTQPAGPFTADVRGQVQYGRISYPSGSAGDAYSVNPGTTALRKLPIGSTIWFRIPGNPGKRWAVGWDVDADTAASGSSIEFSVTQASGSGTLLRAYAGAINEATITASFPADSWCGIENGASDVVIRQEDGTAIHTFVGDGGIERAFDVSMTDTGAYIEDIYIEGPNGEIFDVEIHATGGIVVDRQPSGYPESVAEIANVLARATGGPGIPNYDDAIDLRPEPAGIHIGTAEETTAQAMNRLLLGSSLLWVLSPDGEIVVREWTFSSPVASLRSIDVDRSSVFQPVHMRRLGYQRNERPHNEGEIASALRYSDLYDDDGTQPEANADVTKTITGTSAVTIKRDYQGTPKSSQFDIVRNFYLKSQSADLSGDATWSVSSITGYTMSITDGVLTISDVTAEAPEASFVVTASYAGASYSHVVQVTFQDDAPPVSGGGATSTTFNGPASTSYADLSGAIESTTVDDTVTISATVTHPYTGGDFVTMKVQYSADGSSGWTDVGSESDGQPGSNGGGIPGEPEPEYPGSCTVNVSKSGLSVGVSAYFRILGKRSSGSGALGSGSAKVTP